MKEVDSEIGRLAKLTTAYQTSDKNLAEAVEQTGLASAGSAYRDPSVSPSKATNPEVVLSNARRFGYEPLDPNASSDEVVRLARQTKGYQLSGQLREEVLSDPAKTQKAQELGLLPTAD